MINERPVVAITYNEAFPVDDAVVRRTLGTGVEVRMVKMPTGDLTDPEDDLAAQQMQDAVAVLYRPGGLSRRLLVRCPKLGLIAVHGAGFDKVDLEAAEELGITVTNAPGANAKGVAELTIAVAVALVRELLPVADATKNGHWNE